MTREELRLALRHAEHEEEQARERLTRARQHLDAADDAAAVAEERVSSARAALGGDALARADEREAAQALHATQAPDPGAKSAKGVLERSGGRLTRRMTMYLEIELARRLVRFCAEHEREISDVAAEALGAFLDGQAGRQVARAWESAPPRPRGGSGAARGICHLEPT